GVPVGLAPGRERRLALCQPCTVGVDGPGGVAEALLERLELAGHLAVRTGETPRLERADLELRADSRALLLEALAILLCGDQLDVDRLEAPLDRRRGPGLLADLRPGRGEAPLGVGGA